ncbi:hypothetical protein [Legionella fallonii]|uniref:Uncharacterized protein n=1 Tax=Legionella fallonii LLAP-10 TaxID=1212491 RepID=A0A098G3Q3_9GAMM|nr:hypothetical protein [Legionella fallonii]CEG57102.1 protein of unknown function [Legionella fallonii LLAP-10]
MVRITQAMENTTLAMFITGQETITAPTGLTGYALGTPAVKNVL